MAILSRIIAAGALVAPGCYEPQLRDCVVSCTGPADCAPGQVCGSDGMCAAPEVAGSCAGIVAATDAGSTDARPDARADARVIDAPPPIDAVPQLALQVEITQSGRVMLEGTSLSCTSSSAPCTFNVPIGATLVLRAIPGQGYAFDRWLSSACNGAGALCTIAPTSATSVHAKFMSSGGGGDDDD